MTVAEHLIICLPDCPYCDIEVAADGTSYWCEKCGASWDHNGTAVDEPTTLNGRSQSDG